MIDFLMKIHIIAGTVALATETRPGVRASASFLLSGASTWKGIRVLRFKNAGRNAAAIDMGISTLLGLGGLFTLYQGLVFKSPVLMFFGPLGIFGAVGDLRYWLNRDKPKMHWFFEHMGGMIGSSIAALTAFAALGSRSLGFGSFGVPYFIARAMGQGAGNVIAVTYEYGNTFLIVAGLLNALVVIDAFDISKGRK